MIKEAFSMQLQRKFIIQGLLFFSVFMLIFTLVDGLNMSYPVMAMTYGRYLVILNITLNVFMSLASALLMNLSTSMVILKGSEGKATNLGFLSILFGILTYGCTSCVIAIFTTVGIAFTVTVLPLAGLPYKLVSLLLITLGLVFMLYEIKHGKCKVNLKTT
jgi:hypothetical protein